MRASLTAVAVLIGTLFFAVGCSQSTSPTIPSPTIPTSAPSMTASVTPSSLALLAAHNQVPFKGTGDDVDSDFIGTTVVVTTSGPGNGTHLGRFSFTQTVTVNFTTGTSAGSAHFLAANGDSIDTTVAGSGHPTGTPGEISITDVHTITGGTGRFAGAQGSFTVERLASAITFFTSGSFDGTITSPGAAH
jgi:hypothetical protein